MPDPTGLAQALMDAAIAYIAASFPLVVGGTAALIGAVVACLAWLCNAELRSRATARHITNRPRR